MHFESKCYTCVNMAKCLFLWLVTVPFIFSLFFCLFLFFFLFRWLSVVGPIGMVNVYSVYTIHKSIYCKLWINRSICYTNSQSPTTTTKIWDFIFISFIKFIIDANDDSSISNVINAITLWFFIFIFFFFEFKQFAQCETIRFQTFTVLFDKILIEWIHKIRNHCANVSMFR